MENERIGGVRKERYNIRKSNAKEIVCAMRRDACRMKRYVKEDTTQTVV